MFELLTQILLWLLIGVIAWYILKQFIQPAFYTTLGFLVMVGLLVVAFFEPDTSVVSEAWSVLSLPLRPLGFALFTLILLVPWSDVKFDAKTLQNRQLWVFLTLFISSMPVTAYWLSQQVEQPVAEEIRATAGQAQRSDNNRWPGLSPGASRPTPKPGCPCPPRCGPPSETPACRDRPDTPPDQTCRARPAPAASPRCSGKSRSRHHKTRSPAPWG